MQADPTEVASSDLSALPNGVRLLPWVYTVLLLARIEEFFPWHHLAVP